MKSYNSCSGQWFGAEFFESVETSEPRGRSPRATPATIWETAARCEAQRFQQSAKTKMLKKY